ncbi:hypothetical protein AZA_07438 [Nitrospirillum viridazoti Y2]|nr:hypothetical protein AZA_07438 [Nitrospirillum amazonense Y2]
MQRNGPLARMGRLCIQLLLERRSRRPMITRSGAGLVQRRHGAGHVRHQHRRRQFDAAAWGAQHLRNSGLQGAQVDAAQAVRHLGEGQAIRLAAEAVAVGARAQRQIQQALRPRPARYGGQDGGGMVPRPAPHLRRHHGVVQGGGVGIGPPALRDGRQLQQHLPFRQNALAPGQQRRAVAGVVAIGQLGEGDIVVAVLEGRDAGQDDVGMAGRLVQVDVDTDHQVQLVQGARQSVTVGGGQDGVAGHGEQGPHLALAGRLDLLRQASHRQFTEHLRRVRYAGAAAAQRHAPPLAARPHRVGGEGGGLGEHRPARRIQIAGQDVDGVHQPTGQGAEFLSAGADAAVQHRRLLRCQIPRQGPDGIGRDGGVGGGPFRGEGGDGGAQLLHARHMVRQPAQPHQVFIEQGVHQGRQQKDVAARADEMMLIGQGRRLRPPWVDHHQPAAPRLQVQRLAAEVGHRPQAAVGRHGVATQDDHQPGALNIRHRDAQPMAEHQAAGQLLGHLVQGGGGVDVARAQRPRQHRRV